MSIEPSLHKSESKYFFTISNTKAHSSPNLSQQLILILLHYIFSQYRQPIHLTPPITLLTSAFSLGAPQVHSVPTEVSELLLPLPFFIGDVLLGTVLHVQPVEGSILLISTYIVLHVQPLMSSTLSLMAIQPITFTSCSGFSN